MAHHPLLWPKKNFFCPIGNTVPTLLTCELSPEEDAKVLLLGCGDPRSILYSVYADLGSRKLDFTCCDWEPAVLARNILLLTLIADEATPLHAWAIFYHFFLEELVYDTLIRQCRLLVRFGADTHTWNRSKYGAHFRFCTEQSLFEIRGHWNHYLESESASMEEKDAQKKAFQDGMKSVREGQHGLVMGSMRAAGPLFHLVAEAGAASFQKYWATGVTKSKSFHQSEQHPHLNPTFVHSRAGKRFNVHYGTDPILAFPLAAALACLKDPSSPLSVQSEDLVDSAMKQFFLWSSTFKKRVADGPSVSVVVRFFVGECLALCKALHYCREAKTTATGIYADPWGASQIKFLDEDYTFSPSPPAPLSFNVIDTSNLTDHIGLLNLLIVTVPLLDQKPWSTIRTNSLLQHSSTLSDQLCADTATISIFLGVVPFSNLSHFTTYSNKHEILASLETTRQFHQHLVWKFPQLVFASPSTSLFDTIPLFCDENKLAKMLFSVYLRIFADENVSDMLCNVDINKFMNSSIVHYSRASFAALLALVRQRVANNWIQVMDYLIDLIEGDRTLLMGSNNYQDFLCQLYLQNVYIISTLRPDFIEERRSNRDCFHGWKDVPPVVCVVLEVPRSKLRVLEEIDPDVIKTPMLQCESKGPRFHNTFIHSSNLWKYPCFIRWRRTPVTFYMPSWILTHSPRNTTIGLHVRTTPHTSPLLLPKLGMQLTIYSTPLTDKEHVYIVRHRPDNPGDLGCLPGPPTLPTSFTGFSPMKKVFVDLSVSGSKATSLTVQHSITDADAARSLANGATVSVQATADIGILVSFTGYESLFAYPFPVRGNQCKTRIARKSHYVEVEAPIRPDFEDFLDLSINPFPLFSDGKTVNILGVHYLNMSTLPALRVPVAKERLVWLPIHLETMLSPPEGEAKANRQSQDRGPFLNLKLTISTLFTMFAGVGPTSGRVNTFGLVSPTHGLYALVFVNDIRLDLPSHTIVADACVLPITAGLAERTERLLEVIASRGMMKRTTADDEMRLWIQFFRVLAERCRTWKHSTTCEYQTIRTSFPSKHPMDSPLCSCGKGQDLGAFADIPELKFVSSDATRIAISPLFPFSNALRTVSAKRDGHGPAQNTHHATSGQASTPRCASCGGSGQPGLLTCGGCKEVQYCSRICQKTHWKIHRTKCRKSSSTS